MILIAFRYNDPRLFARIVTAIRGGDSAHVEAAIPAADGHLTLCVSASFLDGGVRGKVIDITNPHKWRVYRWDGDHADPMEWLKPRMKMGYDLRGLLGIVAEEIGHSKNKMFWRPFGHVRHKMFCSEAGASIVKRPDPHTYDLVRFESEVASVSPIVVWSGLQWAEAQPPLSP